MSDIQDANLQDEGLLQDEAPLKDEDYWLSQGEALFRRPAEFVKSVVNLDGLPAAERVEVAFAGRSNVGKSSLLNALVNRKGLARASNTPGRTRELNFFDLDNRLWLVDLPGYGYAKASKVDIARWTKLTNAYLVGRPNLRRIYLLIDSRHGIKSSDLDVMAQLDTSAVSYQVVLTKCDKPKAGVLQEVAAKCAEALKMRPAAHPVILMTSSEKKSGLAGLRAEIVQLLES